MGEWQFWIDRGGTFTDVVGFGPNGELVTTKVLSENPEQYPDAATAGIRKVLGIGFGDPFPQGVVNQVKMGTTVATNALLERKGAQTLLLVNRGFADLLTIGRQTRPRLFDLDIRLPAPLFSAVEEVGGRVDVAGEAIDQIDEIGTLNMLRAYREAGYEAVAIALIHAWKYPEMERRLSELARSAGFRQVSNSHEVSALAGLVARGRTTVVDAYLSPVLRHYVDRVERELGDGLLYFMKSDGGLTRAADFQGKDAILSGPAGGVVGAARTAEAAGESKIIAFDMGGTSTDISIFAGAFERAFDTEVAGVEMRVPMMAIKTVAAGGGSILQFSGGRFRVGPESAGANPGPAAYRRGGPLTVTDANVMCGKILPRHFPAIFGPGGDEPLDQTAVERKFAAMAAEVGDGRGPREIAESYLQIAVANMAAAVKSFALERGQDVAEFALQSFGGAGGQHACLVADELGISRILIHPFAGILSAYGMGLADQSATRQQAIEQPLDDALLLAPIVAQMAAAARSELETAPGIRVAGISTLARLRYAGTDTAIAVDHDSVAAMRAAFRDKHVQRFGFDMPDHEIIVESVIVEAFRSGEKVRPQAPGGGAEAPVEDAEMWTGGRAWTTPVHERGTLPIGCHIAGPAIICEDIGTTVVEPGWSATILSGGELLLTRATPVEIRAIVADKADPGLLELFNNMFVGVAEQMGAVLRNTSISVNIKERLDFSCAVFDAQGRLVANAPHVPVHLGAMGESIRAVLRQRSATLRPGDAFVLNNPYNGGTHLPDVTVVTPVFDADGRELRMFVANRGHHADIGGKTPGSMPPDSRSLEEEGIVIDDFALVEGGVFRERAFREKLAGSKWPARNPDINVADIRAQLAANQAGVNALARMFDRYGWPAVSAYMGHVMSNAEESVRALLDRIGDGAFEYVMDNGAPLKVAVRIDRKARTALVDFTGSGAEDQGNFNAPPAVTRAVILYAFRCLIGEDIPLNEGCLAPLDISLPAGSFLSPSEGRAVVAGNTEISQAICSALLGALGSAASSQATMNNFLFGADTFQYYETICGGAGAGPGFEGASAVHTHMTNTRITDPEILELRYPVRLDRFAIRRGSGGDGSWKGGDGAIRAIRALVPMIATFVGSRRTKAPFGLAGGSDGLAGQQYVERVDGTTTILGGVAAVDLQPGDVFVIETPGGGGYGPPALTQL